MAVLYRKYRSKKLDELVGQAHIVGSLKKAVESGTIAHAYLFTGPRGTGKTSVARILAHMVNEFDYDDPCAHMDIIEIDAASNRRIDEIRDLREKVAIAPSQARYKVYIIDEVHMLTREAFNALLKTLEEPPAHAMFILATTELHKVPETIVSRTQRYAFKPINASDITAHLSLIANNEHITFDPEALDIIAEHASGGFRDAISLLDQVRNTSEKVSVDSVYEAIGMPPAVKIHKLYDALVAHSSEAVTIVKEILQDGHPSEQIVKALLSLALANQSLELAKKLLAIESEVNAQARLLLLAFELSSLDTVPAAEKPPEPVVAPLQSHNQEKDTKHEETNESPSKESSNNVDTSLWEKVLDKLKEGGHAVYGPLRLAETIVDDKAVTIGLTFPFHIKRVNEPKNLQQLLHVIEEVAGRTYEVTVKHLPKASNIKVEEAKAAVTTDGPEEQIQDPLSLVKNVFGGAEVL